MPPKDFRSTPRLTPEERHERDIRYMRLSARRLLKQAASLLEQADKLEQEN